MNLPQGYQLDGAKPGTASVPHGYVLDPAGSEAMPMEDTTALGAAGRGAVGMLPLGEQAYSAVSAAAQKKPYLQARQELAKEVESDVANHGVARTAGQAAGIIAPAVLTGGASAPASLAEAAGEGALVGGGFGAGNAIDTLTSGGSGEKAAGDVALGAALGAGGGALGSKVAGLANEAVPGLEKIAARKAAQGVGLGSDELGHMTEQEVLDTGKFLMNKNIVKPGASTQEMFDTAKKAQETYGDRIGAVGEQANELGLTTDTKPLLDKLGEKFKAASELNNPDEKKAAIWYKRGMADILAMAKRNGAERVGPDIVSAETPASFVTFDQLQKLKKSYGNSAFENGAVKNSAAADVYGALGNGQKEIVNKAATNENLPAELKDAMAGYSKMHPVVSGLQDVLGRERAGNMPAKGFGMMGKMVGQLPGQNNPAINALTALGLIGAGHPMWGIGAATATLQNPRAMSALAKGTANAIPGIAEKLPMAAAQMTGSTAPPPDQKKPSATDINVQHPALAPWKPTFDKNAAKATDEGEVKKSQAITDFVLSQRDPEYAKAKQKASEQPEMGQQPTKMAEGGMVVPQTTIGQPVEGFGSTLEGLANVMRDTKAKPTPMEERLPTKTDMKFHQPFDPDMEEKLKAFLQERKDAESR